MGKQFNISKDKPIATIEGWEDGQHYKRSVTTLDRWELQSAEQLTIHIGQHDLVLLQDPHSPHLGGYVWLSSIIFCSYLDAIHLGMHKGRAHRHDWIHLEHGKRWVELGSGVGLIGLMLHKVGVENIVMTDIDELVPTIEKNVEANGILVQSISGRRENKKSMDDCSSMPTAVVVEPLVWNDDNAIRHIKSSGPIHYILACDCIYSEASAVDLIMTMDKLAGPDTLIICLSEVRNQVAQDTFIKQAQSVFLVELVPPNQWQKKVTNIRFDGTLNLYRLYKPHGHASPLTIGHYNDRSGRRRKSAGNGYTGNFTTTLSEIPSR
ncbi:putative methyltransferase-domain-containing protein [Chlamydoabsidia padenii]|nr:putative methyltransferase-domain-containing protein [Chlamydoabsidia padenii]